MCRHIVIASVLVLALAGCQHSNSPATSEPTYRVIGETWESWRDSMWVASSKVQYTHVDGHVTERLQQSRVEEQWANLMRDVTTYNTEGEQVRWTRSRWQDSTWAPQIRRDFRYEADQLVERRDTSWLASPRVPGYIRQTYTYNEAGEMTEELGEAWDEGSWIPHTRTVSHYNEAGYHLEQQFQTWDGADWQTPRRLLREYNEDGLHTASLRQSWRDGEWHDTIRYTFVLADDSRRLEEHWVRFTKDGWRNMTKVIYHFEEVP